MWIKRISFAANELVALNMEVSEHTHQDDFAIVELSKELPLSFTNTHKSERSNFPVSKVVMSFTSPIPDVAP
jgi:hypothetical protein